MRKKDKKYAVVWLIGDQGVGSEFASTDWPLHVTIVHTFTTDWSLEKMTTELARLLSQYGAIRSRAKDDEQFGNLTVTLLQKTKSLTRLHNDILDVLEEGGLVLENPQYTRENFRPHCTVQKSGRLQKGDHVHMTALSIVDMSSSDSPPRRKILGVIGLVIY